MAEMAKYGYEAIDKLGKEVKGSIDADSEDEVKSKLRGQIGRAHV